MSIEHTRRTLRVLICEDEYLLAMDLAQQLEAFGTRVVGIVGNLADLEHALASIGEPIDVAFLDVQLADGTGYDIAPRLERMGASVVFCSGYSPGDRPEAFSHVPWLEKPFRDDDIAKVLQQVFDSRSDQQSV